MNRVYAALVAACLVGGASAAQAGSPQNAVAASGPEPREVVTLAIPAVDRDTRSLGDTSALRTRAARDIARACDPADRLKANLSPDWRCRREMAASLELALRQTSAQARNDRAMFTGSATGTANPR